MGTVLHSDHLAVGGGWVGGGSGEIGEELGLDGLREAITTVGKGANGSLSPMLTGNCV